jgi:hypothetical protein
MNYCEVISFLFSKKPKYMSMKNKTIGLISVATFLLSLISQEIAYAVPTEWGKVEMSMTQLLSSGWQISGHSSSRAAVGNAGAANNYDSSNFTYLLTKNGRYITCIVQDPRPPIANNVACRSLN